MCNIAHHNTIQTDITTEKKSKFNCVEIEFEDIVNILTQQW